MTKGGKRENTTSEKVRASTQGRERDSIEWKEEASTPQGCIATKMREKTMAREKREIQ